MSHYTMGKKEGSVFADGKENTASYFRRTALVESGSEN